MNWSEEKRIRLVYMSHIIKVIDIISPNRFSNISSYIKKEIIKHISYVPRIHMDNIFLNSLLYNILYLTILCVLIMLFLFTSIRTHATLRTFCFFTSSYLILAVSMRECLGNHSWMSSFISCMAVPKLNGTCFFREAK